MADEFGDTMEELIKSWPKEYRQPIPEKYLHEASQAVLDEILTRAEVLNASSTQPARPFWQTITRRRHNDLNVTYEQFEIYVKDELHRKIKTYPALCRNVQHRVQQCMSGFRLNETRPLKKIGEKLDLMIKTYLPYCESGMTALTSYRVEKCVFKIDASCSDIANCFLPIEDQLDLATVSSNKTIHHSLQVTDGIQNMNWTQVDPAVFGLSLLWAEIYGEDLSAIAKKYERTKLGLELGFFAAALGGIFLIMVPQLTLATFLALWGVKLAALGVGMGTAEVWFGSQMHQAERNETMVTELMT